MPLSCDCYAGCWRAHSEAWPKVKTSGAYNNRGLMLLIGAPYGSYVTLSGEIRLETEELAEKVRRCVTLLKE